MLIELTDLLDGTKFLVNTAFVVDVWPQKTGSRLTLAPSLRCLEIEESCEVLIRLCDEAKTPTQERW
jgi:hypothetical protein